MERATETKAIQKQSSAVTADSGQYAPSISNATVTNSYQTLANNSKAVQRAYNLNAKANPALNQPVQRKSNRTGLPNQLKSGIEQLSGHSMDDVKVHYNSSKPAQLSAHAFAQGTDIHVGAGQEKHLPHEAWHVVQQKQGRVQPTMQLKSSVTIDTSQPYQLQSHDGVIQRDVISTLTLIAEKVGVTAVATSADALITLIATKLGLSKEIVYGLVTGVTALGAAAVVHKLLTMRHSDPAPVHAGAGGGEAAVGGAAPRITRRQAIRLTRESKADRNARVSAAVTVAHAGKLNIPVATFGNARLVKAVTGLAFSQTLTQALIYRKQRADWEAASEAKRLHLVNVAPNPAYETLLGNLRPPLNVTIARAGEAAPQVNTAILNQNILGQTGLRVGLGAHLNLPSGNYNLHLIAGSNLIPIHLIIHGTAHNAGNAHQYHINRETDLTGRINAHFGSGRDIATATDGLFRRQHVATSQAAFKHASVTEMRGRENTVVELGPESVPFLVNEVKTRNLNREYQPGKAYTTWNEYELLTDKGRVKSRFKYGVRNIDRGIYEIHHFEGIG